MRRVAVVRTSQTLGCAFDPITCERDIDMKRSIWTLAGLTLLAFAAMANVALAQN